jgi:hypothetical protein
MVSLSLSLVHSSFFLRRGKPRSAQCLNVRSVFRISQNEARSSCYILHPLNCMKATSHIVRTSAQRLAYQTNELKNRTCWLGETWNSVRRHQTSWSATGGRGDHEAAGPQFAWTRSALSLRFSRSQISFAYKHFDEAVFSLIQEDDGTGRVYCPSSSRRRIASMGSETTVRFQ